jgi:hypothetical protein
VRAAAAEAAAKANRRNATKRPGRETTKRKFDDDELEDAPDPETLDGGLITLARA